MPGIDYAKFDKIEDSDEEDNYDDYLRKTYGVTSDWKPGCGMQPPILGGRTPGKQYEDIELPQLQEVEPNELDYMEDEDVDRDDNENSSCDEKLSPLACSSYCFGVLRLCEIFMWLMPLSIAVTLTMPIGFASMLESPGGRHAGLQSFVYPIVMLLTSIVGLLDAVITGCTTTFAEGSGTLAFACWFKRLFIAYTFLAYEALHTSQGNPWLLRITIVMICFWTARKVWGYGNDLAVLKSRLSTSKIAWSHRYVPWGKRILMLEAVCELLVICSHMANLPEGTNFLGNSNKAVMWCFFFGC
jgi:hypothetical protein